MATITLTTPGSLNAAIDVHIHYSFEEDGEGTAAKQYAGAHAGEG